MGRLSGVFPKWAIFLNFNRRAFKRRFAQVRPLKIATCPIIQRGLSVFLPKYPIFFQFFAALKRCFAQLRLLKIAVCPIIQRAFRRCFAQVSHILDFIGEALRRCFAQVRLLNIAMYPVIQRAIRRRFAQLSHIPDFNWAALMRRSAQVHRLIHCHVPSTA